MNTIPSYIPSNTPPEEVLGMLEAWLPGDVGYSVRAALENMQISEREKAEEEAYDAGRDDAREDADNALRDAIGKALDALEAIPDDNGADASTDRAIAEAIKMLRAAF